MPAFALDPRLAADTIFVADLPLCQLRLMDDARFGWLVLVPRLDDAVEWTDLDRERQAALLAEMNTAASLLRTLGHCDKLNIGALGNVVRQLHVHVVARRIDDAAWPGPVWGSGPAARYDQATRESLVETLRSALSA